MVGRASQRSQARLRVVRAAVAGGSGVNTSTSSAAFHSCGLAAVTRTFTSLALSLGRAVGLRRPAVREEAAFDRRPVLGFAVCFRFEGRAAIGFRLRDSLSPVYPNSIGIERHVRAVTSNASRTSPARSHRALWPSPVSRE